MEIREVRTLISQIMYDASINMGYLFLVPLKGGNVVESYELEVNPDLILDYDESRKLVGIEIMGETAAKLSEWAGKSHVFRNLDDSNSVTFRLTNNNIKKTYKLNNQVVLLFEDEKYEQFLGIDIINMKGFSHVFLANASGMK
jgi:uncharacterized protein YuzE